MSTTAPRLITILLDRSGSMQTVKDDTEGGLRAFLDEQRTAPGKTMVTLRQFNTQHETVYQGVPLADVPPFTLQPRGSTALLDAIGETIASTRRYITGLPDDERPGEVVLVILTDGVENASREWSLDGIKDAIKTARADGWQVLFLAADQDAITVAHGMGIGPDTALSYSSHNTRDTMTTAGRAVSRGTRTGHYGFTDDERRDATR